ncbi:hypothetical protein [Mariprofundus ferrooxydans]|uniref:hypothetical protein n=1 Tax=Mariprofundus ferrooxydans TaxID=314344 RepID=UPI001F0E3D52|nr:hypothetical protein [Mariprofundus ferrooxydans]
MTDQDRWFTAASGGDVEALKQALNIGADVNARDERKTPPCIWLQYMQMRCDC